MYWKNSILSALAVAVAYGAAAGAGEMGHDHQPLEGNPQLEAEAKGGDFTLQSFDGPVSLRDLHGKVTLLFFGFTSCIDICPATLWAVTREFAALTEEELAGVTVLFVSVDPEHDTPEVLKKYTGLFHPNIIGATSREEVLRELAGNYGVVFERVEKADAPRGYVVRHTADILLVDPHGRLLEKRIRFPPAEGEIAASVKKLLARS